MKEKEIKSICPECKKTISARIYEKNGKTWIEKECKKHGFFKDIYWNDINCPQPEELKKNYQKNVVLGNIDLTNRCNMNCSYCFANANDYKSEEPTFAEVKKMLTKLKQNGAKAVQFTGGEPTLRKDLAKIIELANDSGFSHVQLATNGIKLAESEELAQELKTAGLNTVYLKFNGVTEKTNSTIKIMPELLENCRNSKPKLQITLVPTIIKGFNNDEAGKIIEYAYENIDIIRGVNFQPIAFTGRKKIKLKERYTLPDLKKDLGKQIKCLNKKCFYPVNATEKISEAVERILKRKVVKINPHPMCGIATYLMKTKDGMKCITDIMDVNAFLNAIERIANPKTGKIKTILIILKLLRTLPKEFEIWKIIKSMLLSKSYSAIGQLHNKMLLISAMHFQDAYNFDSERVKKCIIYYATPDNKLISFCAYNNLDYRK